MVYLSLYSRYYQYNAHDLKGPMNLAMHRRIGHVHAFACRVLVPLCVHGPFEEDVPGVRER
jgi:hypothetical protein